MWNEKDGIDAATVRGIPAGQKAEVFDNQAFARKELLGVKSRYVTI